jgi:hypothetical protein
LIDWSGPIAASRKFLTPTVRFAPLGALDLDPILARAGDVRPINALRDDTFTFAARLQERMRVEEDLRALDARCVDAGLELVELLSPRRERQASQVLPVKR